MTNSSAQVRKVELGELLLVTPPVPSAKFTATPLFYPLAVLLVCDFVFISFHVLRAYLNDTAYEGFLLDTSWSLVLDRSYPEQFQDLKAGLSAAAILFAYWRRPSLTYVGWSLAFIYIVLDDILMLHERFASWLDGLNALPELAGLGAGVYGQLLLWGVVGSALLPLLIIGYRDKLTRRLSRQLAGVMVGFFLFGGVLDAVHLVTDLAGSSRAVTFALGTVEDGGELMITSFALATALAHLARLRSATAPGQITV